MLLSSLTSATLQFSSTLSIPSGSRTSLLDAQLCPPASRSLNPTAIVQEGTETSRENFVMIRKFESGGPFTCSLGVEGAQCGADHYEERA